MSNAKSLFNKILVNNVEIDINALDANDGKYQLPAGETQATVKFELKDKTTIPANVFTNNPQIKSVKLASTIETIENGAFAGTSLDEESLSYINKINPYSYIVPSVYTEEEVNTYNYALPGALKYDSIKTPAVEPVSEHWVMNGSIYNEDPTYEELQEFETIYNEETWNESFAYGVLKKYYEKNPSEDVWNITENRACNFNDKIYTVEQYTDSACEGEYEVKQYKAQWYSDNGVQKIIDVEDNSIEYYIPTFFDTPNDIFELFAGAEGGYVATPENLINSCDKWIKVKNVSFGGEGVGPAYAGWIANGAQIPWICINFTTDANVKPIFKYIGKDDVYPWNDKIFGTGEGHKEWGIASLPQEFGEGSYDVANLQIILEHQDVEHVEAKQGSEAVLYTKAEVDAYNATIPGAIHVGDIKPQE